MTVSSKKGERSPVQAAPGPISLDAETAAELSRFNQYVALREETDRRERALNKAEADKDRAAAAVRELEGDAKATKERKAEAEKAYKDALAHLTAVKDGKVPDKASAEASDGVNEDDPDATQPDLQAPEPEVQEASDQAPMTGSEPGPPSDGVSGTEPEQVAVASNGTDPEAVPAGEPGEPSDEAQG